LNEPKDDAEHFRTPVAASARSVAALAVVRVLRDGAFAAAALSAELDRASNLEERDRALATELLYGTLRMRTALEARLAPLAPRGIKDVIVKAELLVAAYQLLSLDRVPAFAAVNAAVGAVRGARGPKVAGFANAILRKLASSGQKLVANEAALDNVAPWLLDALTRSVGAEEAQALIVPQLEKVVGLRLLSDRPVPQWLSASAAGRASLALVRSRASGEDVPLRGHGRHDGAPRRRAGPGGARRDGLRRR